MIDGRNKLAGKWSDIDTRVDNVRNRRKLNLL